MRLADLDLLKDELQVIQIEFDSHLSLLSPRGPVQNHHQPAHAWLWNFETKCCSLNCGTILIIVGLCCSTTVQSGDRTLVQWLTRLSSIRGTGQRSASVRFVLTSALVLCLSMAVLGTWVSAKVRDSVLVASGVQASHFMEAFLQPHVQTLQPGGVLDAATIETLDNLLVGTPLSRSMISVKIWRTDGYVLYATNKDLIGQIFDATHVREAAQGAIIAEFESVVRAENAYEKSLNVHLIEVYAPLYLNGTTEVMAVAETYENADALAAELAGSQATTWAVVAIMASFLIALLYLFVRRAVATIAAQRRELSDRYDQAVRTTRETAELRLIADQSRLQASEANEQYLGRLGADIHDGPLQLLTLSILRLTAAAKAMRSGQLPSPETIEQVEGTIHIAQEAMTELRNVSTGLILPEISGLSLSEAVRLAVFRHEDLTGENVDYSPEPLPDPVNEALKICVYRVIQEGLTNTTKHAPGARKVLAVMVDDSAVVIELTDDGPGVAAMAAPEGSHLGLKGMHNRVRALHGSISMKSLPGRGTRLLVRLPIVGTNTASV
jgi:signal transduction histidine kinase